MPKLLIHLPIPSSTFQKLQIANNITDRIASTPFTAISGNNAFVVWEQFVFPGFHLPFIALSKSTDGGDNFSKSIDISDSEPPNWPAIAVSGNDSYVVWQDANFLNPDIDYSIFLSKSTDDGSNFSKPINVSNNTENQVSNLTEHNMEETSNFPSINVSGSTLFVVWQDRINLANFTCTNQDNTTAHCIAYPVKPVKSSIFLSKSTDGGKNFSKPIDISTKTEPFHLPLLVFSRPDIAASGNSVLVAWHQEVNTSNTTAIFLSKSTDSGKNFSKPIDISNNTRYALNPRLAISGNNRYVVWERSYEANPIIKPDIFLSKSTDGGKNFSKPIDISNNTRSYEPTIAASGNSVLVAWQQIPDITKNATGSIFLSKSTDGGNTFSKPIDISNDTQNPINPSLAVYGNDILVAWIGTSGSNADVFITKSTDGGNTFSKPIDISLLGFQK